MRPQESMLILAKDLAKDLTWSTRKIRESTCFSAKEWPFADNMYYVYIYMYMYIIMILLIV